MKKLVIIMIILSIIFIGMILYKKTGTNTNNINIQEIEKIESYINQIYMWKEITEEALPEFSDINQAKERWIWEVVKKNIEDDELSYEQIQEKAKELFGEILTKEFPREGTDYLKYNEKTNKYQSIGIEVEQMVDLFLIDTINKTKNGYEVEIIEYLEDNSPMFKEEMQDYIIIRNLKEEEIGRVSGFSEEEERELVKRNKEKFSKKKLKLKNDKDKLYIEKVED